ncbi:hypothetical protein A2859_01810 [Candidatus Roizmanbacteria bacterium RIFCSPHIGHO2_01_FULL_37_16b]|nr:MAG: hypothetical protein A2859_01810 [Candidatus Roizmanbacteria bacterium RIFCSPHIGHO2_01_FULL_37_16b]
MNAKLERLSSPEFRNKLFQQQFELTKEFYRVPYSNPVDKSTRFEHRRISQIMANNAIDLALPSILQNMEKNNLTEIALVAELRGSLALITPETIEHLIKRLNSVERGGITISLWAQGIKRYPNLQDSSLDHTEMYFESGYLDKDLNNVHVVLMDWGTATGSTNRDGAKALKSHGLDYGHMTNISMTISEEAEQRLIEDCQDDTGSINIQATTRAKLNDIKYVEWIAPFIDFDKRQIGEFIRVEEGPKDWGDVMWGMIDHAWGKLERPETSEEIKKDIEEFIAVFADTYRDFILDDEIENLKKIYFEKYRIKL